MDTSVSFQKRPGPAIPASESKSRPGRFYSSSVSVPGCLPLSLQFLQLCSTNRPRQRVGSIMSMLCYAMQLRSQRQHKHKGRGVWSSGRRWSVTASSTNWSFTISISQAEAVDLVDELLRGSREKCNGRSITTGHFSSQGILKS